MRERDIQNQIRLGVSEQCQGVIFRTNAGQAWAGDRVYSHEFRQNVLVNIRPVKLLVPGFSDLLYLGPERNATFIECKTPKGPVREEQERFIELMRSYGFNAGICRSVEDAVTLINK